MKITDALLLIVTGTIFYVLLLFCILLTGIALKANTIQSVITKTAIEQGMDPVLALAVAEVESDFNPRRTGKHGEIGLFQLHPKFHPDASYDVKANVTKGIRTLIYWQQNCPNKANLTWVTCFNGGFRRLRSPETAPYYKKVMLRYRRMNTPVIQRPPSEARLPLSRVPSL